VDLAGTQAVPVAAAGKIPFYGGKNEVQLRHLLACVPIAKQSIPVVEHPGLGLLQ